MRQVREVLRLKHAAGLSERHIAGALRISRSTVSEYLRRAAVVGLTWPVPADLDDAALERRLFSPPELQRVFEPFYRLESSRSRETGGSGLGLSIAMSILEAHGGNITLANRRGGGLRASIQLPS
jgi:hypothetical protein